MPRVNNDYRVVLYSIIIARKILLFIWFNTPKLFFLLCQHIYFINTAQL